MTAPQLSVDTVSESVYKDNVAHKENTVKNNISIDGLDKEKRHRVPICSPGRQKRRSDARQRLYV